MPESLRRWKNLDSSTTNYASNSDQLNLEDKSNAWYSSNQIRYETNAKNILKTEQDMPDFQVNMNAKYNIYDNMIIQGNDQQKYSTKAKITRNKHVQSKKVQCFGRMSKMNTCKVKHLLWILESTLTSFQSS